MDNHAKKALNVRLNEINGDNMERDLKIIIVSVLAFALVSVFPGQVQGEEIGLEMLDTKILVNIHNSYAITEVKQNLINHNSTAQEHTFMFSVPESAFVSNLTIEVGDDIMYSISVPKEVASAAYNYQIEQGATASLLTYRGNSMYTHSFNIEAGESADIIFRFEQMIPKHLGFYSYDMIVDPNALGGSFEFKAKIHYPDQIANVSISGLPEPEIEFKEINKVLVIDSCDSYEVSEKIFLNYTTAFLPPEGRMAFYEDQETGYFMHMFAPQVDDVGGETIPKEIGFCLDKSGSMIGEKIQQLKDAFTSIIPALDSRDRFGVVTFNSDVQRLVSDEIIQASSTNVQIAVDEVENIVAGGATNIGLAIETGLEQMNNQEAPNPIIVLLTDGRPTTGTTNTEQLRELIRNANAIGAQIYCLGFGNNLDFELLEAIALENGGEAIRIYIGMDATDQITDFYDMISITTLSGIEFNYFPGAESWYPEESPSLFQGSEIIVTGLYEKGQEKLTACINGTTQQGMVSYTKTFHTDPDPDDEYISRFWGYSRINHLLDLMAVEGEMD